LARSPGHPFYKRLNELLDGEKFDEFVEGLCGKFYAPRMGRPGLAPGIYFRSLLIGYFEGIDSERGIGWRLADSLVLRQFVLHWEYGADGGPLDDLADAATDRCGDPSGGVRLGAGVAGGSRIDPGQAGGYRCNHAGGQRSHALDCAARHGESYEEFLTGLAKALGMETPTREDLARLGRKRKKRTSNKEWMSSADPDARVTKMKGGRTHLAHKAEHAVDLDTRQW